MSIVMTKRDNSFLIRIKAVVFFESFGWKAVFSKIRMFIVEFKQFTSIL